MPVKGKEAVEKPIHRKFLFSGLKFAALFCLTFVLFASFVPETLAFFRHMAEIHWFLWLVFFLAFFILYVGTAVAALVYLFLGFVLWYLEKTPFYHGRS